MTTHSPKSSLLSHARRIAREVEDVGSVDDFLAERGERADTPAEWTNPATLLAEAMLREALPKRTRERLLKPNGIAICVQVPGPGWVEPVHHALLATGTWGQAIKRDGSSRQTDVSTVGNQGVSEALARGKNVHGVSQNPARHLPATLTALADIHLVLTEPSNHVLADVIERVTGTRPRGLPANVARGLTAEAIAACIRPGSSRDCVRRLTAASQAQGVPEDDLRTVPLLCETWGYGEDVLAWGSSLIAAVEDYRNKKRAWSSIENRHIVLSGDPGTGKTTLARILAKSTGLPLHTTSVSAWFATTNGYLNDVCKAIDEAFSRAAAGGPGILLLDELDAIPNRATLDSRHREWWVPVVSHVLLALDSAVSGASSSLIVIGATNHPERLDEALTRPGRLNRVVRIRRPDVPAIAGILRQHLGDALPGVDLVPVASIGSGATGAEVAGWAKGARMTARAADREMVLDDLLHQLAPPETRSAELLRATARHEASHAVSSTLLDTAEVLTVSIVARGRFAGRTSTRPRSHEAMTSDEMDAFIVSVLAGRAADEHWHAVTSGSAGGPGSDLAHATAIVAGKHATYGLGGSLLYRGAANEVQDLLREPAFRALCERDLARLYAVSLAFVRAHEAAIEAVAQRLLQRRVLGGDEVRAIIAASTAPPAADEAPGERGGRHG